MIKTPSLPRVTPLNVERGKNVRILWNWWQRRASWGVNLSVLTLAVLTCMVLLADVIAPYDPTQIDLRARLQPPVLVSDAGTWAHPLGTDATGRDILSRVLYGGQVSLVIGAAATVLGLAVGTLIGLVSGYLRGWVDEVLMYIVDVQLALPFILLAIAVALVLGKTLFVLIALAAISTVPIVARLVRGEVLSLREREFVTAARAAGASSAHIIRTHLLPNIAGPVLVLAALSIGRIILLESGLSFLGIGVQPPTPSWGSMINEGRELLSTAWWLSTVPGVFLLILTMAIGTLGDWLRDVLDVASS